jgi:FAD/FMN-containing dehydrogenase
MGMFGFGVDSILEMSVVTADGEMRTVSATENEDLFWAMRGAGPNFGIVIAATVKAYAMPKEERVAWGGALIFTDDKLEKVVEALQNLELSDRMVAFMYFSSAGPPSHTPMVVVTVWMFQGTPETGRAAFRTLFDLEPMVDTTSVLPYTEWNTGADPHCTHSERKPTFAAGFDRLDATTWRGVWDKFVEFQKRPGAHGSTILLEMYPMNDIRLAGEAWTSFPYRRVRFQAAVMAWYNDSSLDEEAEKFGRGVRQLWESSGGAGKNSP